jgi:hypothetical protein
MLYPWMLLGLTGLGVPIIIHLIQRQRLRPQVLATLQFLDPEDTANAFAPVPRDLLQLLLRLLLLTLFVLLMSRLLFTGSAVGPRTLAVLLDSSLTMQQKFDDNQTLFQKHKQQVLQLIDGLRPSDRMALLLVGDKVLAETGFLQDREELRRIAEGFEVSDGGGLALMPAIRRTVLQLAGRREVNACVLVFSDQQQVHYAPYQEEAGKGGDDNPTTAFRDELERGQVKLFLIDERSPGGVNLSVEQVRFSPETVHVGASSRVTAVVRNHTDEQQTTTVRFFEGEQAGLQRSLTLGPREAAHIDLVHRFEAPVDSACRVEIDPDVLPGDNRFYLPMRIRDRRQVLLVTPASAGGEERGLELSFRGVDLLAYALNPGEALGKGAGTAIQVKRITPQQFGRVSLPIYSLIILYGVTDLSEQSARDLAAFVGNGGGVWLIPEHEGSPLRFNEGYGQLLNGLAIGQLKQPPQPPTIDRAEGAVTHPLFLPLLREEWGNPRDLTFNQYFALQSPGNAAIALRTATGDPLVALARRERGLVLLQLFPGDLDSSTLPRTSAFVPLVQQTVALLGQRGEPERPDVLRVGEVHRLHVPEFRSLKGDVVVKGPQERRFPVTTAEGGEVRVEGLTRAGAYEVSHPARKTNRPRFLAVNPVLGVSDLAPLPEEAQADLFGSRNVLRLPFAELDEQFARRHELLAWLIVLVLAAFVAEALLGAWQARRRVQTAAGRAGSVSDRSGEGTR